MPRRAERKGEEVASSQSSSQAPRRAPWSTCLCAHAGGEGERLVGLVGCPRSVAPTPTAASAAETAARDARIVMASLPGGPRRP